MNRTQQEQFLQATAWLRPVTRWAASFSMATAPVLPAAIRNLPLKAVKAILSGYQRKFQGPGGCQH